MTILMTSTQEVVLRLGNKTMQRLIVGMADHLQYTVTSEPAAQHQPASTSMSTATPTNSTGGKQDSKYHLSP